MHFFCRCVNIPVHSSVVGITRKPSLDHFAQTTRQTTNNTPRRSRAFFIMWPWSQIIIYYCQIIVKLLFSKRPSRSEVMFEVMVTGESSRSQVETIAKVVGATSSEVYYVYSAWVIIMSYPYCRRTCLPVSLSLSVVCAFRHLSNAVRFINRSVESTD